MATAVLFIGWNRPYPGREGDAFRFLLSEGTEMLEKFKADGFYESREHVGLTAHGGDLNGFMLLFGERAKLDELRRTDAFEKFVMRLGTLMNGLGVIPGLNSAGLEAAMKRNTDIFK